MFFYRLEFFNYHEDNNKNSRGDCTKLYSFNPLIIVILLLLLLSACKLKTECRKYSYWRDEQTIINCLPIYMNYLQKHEEKTEIAESGNPDTESSDTSAMTSNSTLQNAVDEFPIPYFSLKDLDCDNVYELFVKEMVNEDYARWHIYTLGENGKLEPLRMEDGREAIFDERNDSEGGFDFFSVHSLSCKKTDENDDVLCTQRNSLIIREEYDSLVEDCQNGFYQFKNTAEGRKYPYKKECWFIKGHCEPIEIIHNEVDDQMPEEDFVIDFNDEALEANIRRVTGITTGDIKYGDVSSITSLTVVTDVSGKKIRNISDLRYFTNLESLVLDFQEIRDISALNGLLRLKHLSLLNNDIRDITPLRELDLETLELDNNKIKNIRALSGMKTLKTLHLANNRISDISVLHDLKMLRSISLYGNRVRDLSPLRGLINLSYLDIGNNGLRDISALENLQELSGLDICENRIQDISAIKKLTMLSRLNASDNRISDINALSGLTELYSLRMKNNRISDIEPLRSMWRLDNLDLSNNRVSDVDVLNNLELLSQVDLSGNPIIDLGSIENTLKEGK